MSDGLFLIRSLCLHIFHCRVVRDVLSRNLFSPAREAGEFKLFSEVGVARFRRDFLHGHFLSDNRKFVGKSQVIWGVLPSDTILEG